jgi:hypothetical protein
MNSLKNITVPLTSNLNMNRNKSLTCSSYDILNGINAPVFGGSISPLHYKVDYQGDAKYSVDGERWTMDSNKLYRGGLLFKDFSGEYTFDMVDTKLDLDSVVVNGNEFVGIKVNRNATIDWFRLDSNFNQLASGNIAGFFSIKGFKLCVRENSIFLLVGDEATISIPKPEYLYIYRWENNSFVAKEYYNFKFVKQNEASTWDTYNIPLNGAVNTKQWFFTMSQGITVANDAKFGVTVFNGRPNGYSTFNSAWYADLVFNRDGTGIEQVQLMSGPSQNINVATDAGGVEGKSNHNCQAFFIDNSLKVMSVGHVKDSRDYPWCKMATYTSIFYQDGTYDDCRRLYCFIGLENPGAEPSNVNYPAILVENGQDKFAEIKGIGSSCLTVNYNGYARLVIAGYGRANTKDSANGMVAPTVDKVFDASFFEYGERVNQTYAEMYGLMNAGVTSNASLPTTEDGWKSWWDNRDVSNNTAWNPAGVRLSIGNTNFYTLYNGKEGNAAGISYSTGGKHVGTLLTEWGSIVQTFENCATADKVIFKDAKTNTVKYIQRRNNITLDDVEVVGKYVLVRCTADENIYDISSGKWAKFSNDWNNRIFFGYRDTTRQSLLLTNLKFLQYTYFRMVATIKYGDSWATSGSVAAGYDVAFQKEKGFAPSRLYNYTSLSGIVLGEVNAFGYELTSENGLDVFASSGTSAPAYKTTLFGNGASSCVSNLAGGVYPITSSGSAYFNIPIIESTVVDSYNGKYGLKIDGSVYTIAYDGIRPIALYNTSSIVDQVDDFFIVQSQYYALINGYICSLSYSSSNVISGVEQIVNVQGMKFIGAFPSCAYFYSPSARAIFAFTGDADLQLFVQTDRITEIYNSKYYSNCEWIFMSTSDGLYVMTQNNTFKIDAMNVKRFFPTDDEYCVLVLDNETNDNIFISMNRYSGWNTMPVVLETSFFGDGDMKKSTITDWYIRVFKGDEDYNGTVKCSAKTITDVVSQVVKTFDGTKEEKLTKDKFDSNDNAMITFHTGCNALGTSCRVESSYPICYFGFSIGSDGSTNKSKLNI